MKRCMGLWVAIGLLWLAAGFCMGQEPPYGAVEPVDRAGEEPLVQPDQPVVPQDPVLRPRTPPTPPPPPFTLTPQEEAVLDRVLLFWEKSSLTVRNFACQFTRREYDEINGRQESQFLVAVDKGEVRFSSPDKAALWVDQEVRPATPQKAAEWVDKGPRREHWIYNGKSIFEYNYGLKVITEYRLPPEMQGKAITEKGPLPFLFGATRAGLKKRFFVRLITPEEAAKKGQIWLEAHPRFLDDARNFSRAEVILTVEKEQLVPAAVQLFQPNGKNRTVYVLSGMSLNALGLGNLLNDPFSPRKPGAEWRFEVAQAEPAAVPPRTPPQGIFPPAPGPTGSQPRTRR